MLCKKAHGFLSEIIISINRCSSCCFYSDYSADSGYSADYYSGSCYYSYSADFCSAGSDYFS